VLRVRHDSGDFLNLVDVLIDDMFDQLLQRLLKKQKCLGESRFEKEEGMMGPGSG
jgi:hypothetical protein